MATLEEFKRIELKVAKILEAAKHPNADRLLILTVDSGAGPKQVVSGIAQHYQPEELVGKHVVVVDNLDPATIRGTVSNGMILAASDEGSLCLVTPERPIRVGSVVR